MTGIDETAANVNDYDGLTTAGPLAELADATDSKSSVCEAGKPPQVVSHQATPETGSDAQKAPSEQNVGRKVVKVLAHIEFPCARCGGPAVCIGLAAVTDDGRIGEPEKPERDICNTCNRADRDAETAEIHKAQEQRRWARQAAKPVKPKGVRP